MWQDAFVLKIEICKYRNIVGAILALTLAGCHGGAPSETAGTSVPAVAVQTGQATRRSIPGTLTVPGTLRARREATVASKLPGRILYLQAEEGDVVSPGSTLAEIDVSSLRAHVAQAEAARRAAEAQVAQADAARAQAQAGLQRARAQLVSVQKQRGEVEARYKLAGLEVQRYRTLVQKGAIPRQQADRVETEYKVLREQLGQVDAQSRAARMGVEEALAGVAQAQRGIARSEAGVGEAQAGIVAAASDLEDGTVTAPFRGVVVQKLANQGEVNVPGRPLLKLQDLDSLEVSAAVPDTLAEKIQPGSRHQVEIPALHLRREVRVRQIIASSDPSSRTFEVRLSLLQTHPKLFPGMFVRLPLAQDGRTAVLIPSHSVVRRGQLEGVFVVSNGQAEFRLLQLGAAQKNEVEVLSGLQGGETLVLDAPESLQDGATVQP